MNYKWFIMCLMALWILSGCQFNDVDKRFFVVGIGIDQSTDEAKPFRVMVKLAVPSAQVQTGNSNFQIISQDASSIPEAIQLIQAKVDKKLDFGHCRAIILNKSLLHRDQLEFMKWFIKRPDIQGIAYVAVGEPSAKEILSRKIKSERLPGNALVLAFDEVTNNSPYISSEILNDYYMRLREEGVDPYLPVIEPIDETYKINKSVVLKGTKIGGELNPDETRMLNELINPNKTTLIMVGKGKNHYFLNAEHTGLKMTINTPKTGAPYVDVHIKIQGMIEESKKSVYERREIIEVERQASITISSRVKKFLEHLQTLGVDPLGLGLNYQVKHGITDRDLQAWYAIYPNLEFHVKTDVILKGTGTLY